MVPLFGAAYAAPKKAPPSYTDLALQNQCWILLQMVKFKDFSRPLSVFQVLFKANFISKDFSRQSCIFKHVRTMLKMELTDWHEKDFVLQTKDKQTFSS